MNAYLIAQLPLLAGFVGLFLLAVAFPRAGRGADAVSHAVTLAALGLTAAFSVLWLMPGEEFFGGAVRVTLIGRAVAILALAAAFGAALLSGGYLAKIGARATEFRMVVLAQALGLFHLPLAGDLPTLFITFELVSIPSYVLAGFNFRDGRAREAGMKYLILGALSSALFLLGLVFLFGATGETQLAAIRDAIGGFLLEGGEAGQARLVLAKAALAFLLAALLFKVAAAPFHFWLPDVYQGANFASLAFIAAPAKLALFGLVALILWGPFAYLHETWKPLLLVAALLSALFGNFQALAQANLKRLLAFSSAVNAGFILLALFLESAGAFLLYLAAYGVTVVGALAALMALGTRNADVDDVSDLSGLGRRHPWISGVLTLMLFSLAGIPLTAGFAAKFSIAADAFTPGFLAFPGFVPVLVASLALSLVSFAFYFRIVRALWLTPVTGSSGEPRPDDSAFAPAGALFACGAAALLVVLLGVLMRVPGLP